MAVGWIEPIVDLWFLMEVRKLQISYISTLTPHINSSFIASAVIYSVASSLYRLFHAFLDPKLITIQHGVPRWPRGNYQTVKSKATLFKNINFFPVKSCRTWKYIRKTQTFFLVFEVLPNIIFKNTVLFT